MRNIFTEHPKEVGETYSQHFKVAMGIAWKTYWVSWAAFIHAFFPFWHTKTASDAIKGLAKKCANRNAQSDVK